MTDHTKNDTNPLSYLPHQGTEFEGHAALDAVDTADDAIRAIMTEQKREISRKSLPEIAPLVSPEALQPGPPKLRSKKAVKQPRRTAAAPAEHSARRRFPLRLPKLSALRRKKNETAALAAAGRSGGPTVHGILHEVRSFRPSRRMVFWVAVAGIMLWRPWLLPLVLIIAFWVALITYLTIGPDRVVELVSKSWLKLAMRHPGLAERLRLRADAVAMKIDAILDVIPGNWTEHVSLPDFSETLEQRLAAADAPDPFDQLPSEARSA